MMQTLEPIPLGSGELASDDFVVDVGTLATVVIHDEGIHPPGGLKFAEVAIQVKAQDGYYTVGNVTNTRPAYRIRSAGVYRLLRTINSQPAGATVHIGAVGGGGSGGGGDASAANQLAIINRVEQGNSYLLDVSNRTATADLQSVGNTTLITIRDNASTIAGRIAPISATVARKVAITSTATSIALSPAARYIDFRAVGTDAYYVISTGSPVATADSHYIGKDERIMRGVTTNMSISVLSASGDAGMLYITER